MTNMTAQEPGPISHVRRGMRVVDRDGDEVGRVDEVKLGDPQAVTGQGQTSGRGESLIEDLAKALVGRSKPDLPAQQAAQLLRTGYLKINGQGVLAGDVYVGPEVVDSVAGDDVILAVPRSQLAAGN